MATFKIKMKSESSPKNTMKKRFKKRYIAYGLFLAYVVMCQACMTMRFTKKETKYFFDSAGLPYKDTVFTTQGRDIHYIITGNDKLPTLFFIHGSPGSWNAFKDYMKDTLLLQKYRLVAVDRPGFGYSDFGEAEGLLPQCEQIGALIRFLDNGQPKTLVGHSLGGPVVVKLAAMHPDWYKNLVVLSGSVDPKAETPEKWRAVIKTTPLRFLIPGALRASNDELWILKKDLYDLQPTLKNITADVLIIHGTKDPLVPYSNVGFMKFEFVNARSMKVISIKDANHFIPWEHYDEIRDALLKL
ncbi:alpha/beta fold hydrolase [Flavobacterium magnum]|nr:alpha/beta hydrolase [Flavobacterium magnum]